MPRTNAHVGVVWTSRDRRLLNSQRRIQRQQQQLNRSVSAFTQRLAAIGAGFIGFNVLFGQINQLRSTFDDLNKRSRELGLSARSTLILRSALEQTGIEGDRVTRTLSRILDFGRQLRIGRLTESITEGVNAQLLNLVRQGAGLEDILEQLAGQSPEEITAFARAAGVRDTTQFVRVVEELGEPLRRTRELFDQLGIALQDATLALNEEFNDALVRFRAVLTATIADFFLGGTAQGISQQAVADRLDAVIVGVARVLRAVLEVGREIVVNLGRLPISLQGVVTGYGLRIARGILQYVGFGALFTALRRLPLLIRVIAIAVGALSRVLRPLRNLSLRFNFQQFSRGVDRLQQSAFRTPTFRNYLNDVLTAATSILRLFVLRLQVGLRKAVGRLVGGNRLRNADLALTRLETAVARYAARLSNFISSAFNFLRRPYVIATTNQTILRFYDGIVRGIRGIRDFITANAFRSAGATVAVGEVIVRYWEGIRNFIGGIFNVVDRITFGLLDWVQNLYNVFRDAWNRGFNNPDVNDTRSFLDRVLGGARSNRVNWLDTFNQQFVAATRTAVDYANDTRRISDGLARSLNETINEMVTGLADGTANMRAIWRNFLNEFIKTLQDTLLLRPLEDGIAQIAGAVGRGILDFAGVIPDAPTGLGREVGRGGTAGTLGSGNIPALGVTSQQAQSPVVVNQEFNFNRGVDAADATDISLRAAQAVQSDFLIKVGRAGTPESRAIKGY